MTRQEAMINLNAIRDYLASGNPIWDIDIIKESFDMAIYALGTIDELKKERDAALDTAFAALRMREERDG